MVRGALAVTARLSPGLAAALATRLFLTPRRYPRPARERALLERAEPLPREDGLAAWSWGRGPTVLLAHGWAGRGAQLGSFVEPLVAAGYRVVAFDAPAHGASPGRRTNLIDMADALARVADSVGPLHAVIAHSFGAAATMVAFSRGLDARSAVFVAPPWSLSEGLNTFAAALALPPEVIQGVRAEIERRVGLSWDAFEGATLAPQMTVPLLVVHDRDDPEVPLASGASLVRAWPDAELYETYGLGHRRILRDPVVIAASIDRIARVAAAPRDATPLERLLDLEGLRL
jgi:pimeloyl-ACP methyl ester carboxylesterase